MASLLEGAAWYGSLWNTWSVVEKTEGAVMSMHASVLVDSVGPPSAEVCRTASSFP
jgi:hypothetical protein